jgi:hypothetical protein
MPTRAPATMPTTEPADGPDEAPDAVRAVPDTVEEVEGENRTTAVVVEGRVKEVEMGRVVEIVGGSWVDVEVNVNWGAVVTTTAGVVTETVTAGGVALDVTCTGVGVVLVSMGGITTGGELDLVGGDGGSAAAEVMAEVSGTVTGGATA